MQRISTLLNRQSELASLSEQATSLLAIQQLWANAVPETLKKYTQAGGVKHKRLNVYVDNGAVAAKIKLMLPSILTKLQKQGLEVTSIRVEVQVKSHAKLAEKPLRTVSKQGVESLSELAERLDGTVLAESLKRLSKHS